MSKVTSKYQVSLPRHLARAHRIEPGSEIAFESAGDVIRIRLEEGLRRSVESVEEALESFDEATRRQDARREDILGRLAGGPEGGGERGWTRDELYTERIDRRSR